MKIHLRYGSKGYATQGKTQAATPACDTAKRNYGHGQIVLSPSAFYAHENEAELCQHCKDIFLRRRNVSRKEKGLKPVTKYNAPAAKITVE